MSSDRRPSLGPHDAPRIHASAGTAELGERVVVWGRDLHRDCKDMSFVGYALLCATGQAFPATEARVFEELWIATGYPDARIWCNRIVGYLASVRVDPGLAMSAALAACNSMGYGFGAMRAAFAVQLAIPHDDAERECWLARVLGDRQLLHGYGRPIHNRDERIAVALRTLRDQGLRAGPQLKRAFWLDARLRARKNIGLNIAAVWAAVAIDFGLTQTAYEQFMLLMLTPGFMAVYADQRARQAGSFLAGHQSLPPAD